MKSRRVVVLGGTGFLGTEVARAFVADGAEVLVVGRRQPSGARAAALGGAGIVVGQAEDPVLVAGLLEHADHVVYAVGAPLPEEADRMPVDSVLFTLPGLLVVLEALRLRPSVGITYFSSGGTVYGNPPALPVGESAPCEPITVYGVSKLAAEAYLDLYARLYGIPVRVLRVANAYGPTQDPARGQGVVAAFLAAARTGSPVRLYGDGGTVRDYVHVSDVADAVVRLAGQRGGPRVLNVGTQVGHTVRQVLEIVGEVTGWRPRVEVRPARDHDVRAVVLDVSQLGATIPWTPIGLEAGIARMWRDLVEPSSELRTGQLG